MARRPADKRLPLPAALANCPIKTDRHAEVITLLADTLLTAEELAARWVCSTQTLNNNRRAQRGLPFIKLPISGAIRYRLSDVVRAELQGSSGPIAPRDGGAYTKSRHAFDPNLSMAQRTCATCGAYR